MVSHSFEWDPPFGCSKKKKKKILISSEKDEITDLETWDAWKLKLECSDGSQTLYVGKAHRGLRIHKIPCQNGHHNGPYSWSIFSTIVTTFFSVFLNISLSLERGSSCYPFQQNFPNQPLQIKLTSNSKTHKFLSPPNPKFLHFLHKASLNPSTNLTNCKESRNISNESALGFDSSKEIWQNQSQVCRSSRRDLTWSLKLLFKDKRGIFHLLIIHASKSLT